MLYVGVLASSGVAHMPAHAIVVHPTAEEVQVALDQGKEAAQRQSPPDTFLCSIRSHPTKFIPTGFFITKLGGLSVMATHMALRGIQSSEADVTQILEEPDHAGQHHHLRECSQLRGRQLYGVRTGRENDQASHRAIRCTSPPQCRLAESPRFKANVVASFNYADFDPNAKTTITVYPANGGESSFHMNFDEID